MCSSVFNFIEASAQFMVVTTYDGDQTENIDKLTANLGFGYTVMDGITVGVVRSSGPSQCDEDSFELWGRYDLGAFMEGAYLSKPNATEDMADHIKVGLGMSFSVWNNLYLGQTTQCLYKKMMLQVKEKESLILELDIDSNILQTK